MKIAIAVLGNGCADTSLGPRKREVVFEGKRVLPVLSDSGAERVTRAVDWIRQRMEQKDEVSQLIFTSGCRNGYYPDSAAELMLKVAESNLCYLKGAENILRVVNRCRKVNGLFRELSWVYRKVDDPDVRIWVVAAGWQMPLIKFVNWLLGAMGRQVDFRVVPVDLPPMEFHSTWGPDVPRPVPFE